MSFLTELWAFMRERKKFWLAPIMLYAARLRRPDHPGARIGSGPVHLHVVLTECAFSASPRSITTAPQRCWSTAVMMAAAQEERFTRKKQDARFPRARDRLLPGRSQ